MSDAYSAQRSKIFVAVFANPFAERRIGENHMSQVKNQHLLELCRSVTSLGVFLKFRKPRQRGPHRGPHQATVVLNWRPNP